MTPLLANSQQPDSISTIERLSRVNTPQELFADSLFTNPANMTAKREFSVSTLTAVYYDEKDKDGTRVNIGTYILLDRDTRVWGSAIYENRKRRDVKWNETSDIETVYPYLTADTVGGHMSGETYSFEGGYAKRAGRWSIGGSFGYKALIEYRNVDPRPRNVSHDISLKAGASYAVNNRYGIGLAAQGGRYKQNCTIAFYNELGGQKEFHLTGLGMTYHRFDGGNYNSNYKGWEYGISAQFLPLSHNGILANASVTATTIDKQLSSVANITVNRLRTVTYSMSAGYMSTRMGCKAYVSMHKRKGAENIYGDPSGDIYPLISTTHPWTLDRNRYGLDGYVSVRRGRFSFSGMLDTGYNTYNEVYSLPVQWRKADDISGMLTLRAQYCHKKNLIRIDIGGGLRLNVSNGLNLTQAPNPYAMRVIKASFDKQTSDAHKLLANVEWSHLLSGRYALTASAAAAHITDIGVTWGLTIGLAM